MHSRTSLPALTLAAAWLAALLGADRPTATLKADAPARQPQVAVASDGRVYVAFGVGTSIRCATSADGGKSFAEPVEVGKAPTLALGMRRGPRIAVAGDSVLVAAIVGELGGGKDGDLLLWCSTDQGKTWGEPTRINTVPASAREGLHALAAGPKGTVFCTWLDDRAKRKELWGRRSTDGGKTWEADRLVYRSPERSICECCHPSAAFAPDGTLYVMWRNSLRGARDMYLVRSDDGGATFGPAEKLGEGTWRLQACPMDGGALAAGPSGRLGTVWRRETTVYAAEPGSPERPLGAGLQGWTAAGHGGTYAVWLEQRPGRLMLLGPDAKEPAVLAESANDPVVAAPVDGRGPVVAAWESAADGGTIRVAVLPPARD